MSAWIAIVAAGVAVYSLRAVLLLAHRIRPPAAIERTLTFVAPAALAALVTPAMVTGAGGSGLVIVPRAAALAAGAVVAHRGRSIGATVAVGMAVLWAATAACQALS